MDMYTKFFRVALLMLLFSCEQASQVLPNVSDPWLGSWQYEYLIIQGDTLNKILDDFEPGGASSNLEDVFHIRWKWFVYSADQTYEFRDNVGMWFSIGGYSKNDLNYQPFFGTWRYDEFNKILTHNPGEPYKKSYRTINLTTNQWIREYERTITRIDPSFSDKWGKEVGDTVTYREILIRRE